MANKTFLASSRTRRRVALTLAAFAALAPGMLTPAHAQTPDPATMSEIDKAAIMPPGDKQISGIVVNEQKQPVASISVELYWQWSVKQKNGSVQVTSSSVAEAITDAQGRFVFPKLSAGQFVYYINSSKNEYVTQNASLVLDQSDTQKTLHIVVSRGALVTGKVMDKMGKPLADVAVEVGLIPPGGDMAKWQQWLATSFAQTDAQGRYQTRIRPGDVFVGVGRSIGSSAISLRVLAAACRVAAPAGKTAAAPNLSVLLRPMVICVGPDGKPIADMTYRIIPDNLGKGGYLTEATTDAAGAAVLGRNIYVPQADSGSFSIIKDDLAALGTYHWSPDGPLVVMVNGQETRYPDGVGMLRLQPGFTSLVTGTVVSEDGKPIPDAVIWIETIDPQSLSIVDHKIVKADAAGVFRLTLDPKGQCQAYVRADGFNRMPLLDKTLTLEAGKPKDLGAIHLQRAEGFITSTVADTAGKPMEGVLAYVVGGKTGLSAAVTDAQGRFHIPNIVPGERLRLKLNSKGEAPDSGQAQWNGNENMDIPDAYATPTPVKIVWRPK